MKMDAPLGTCEIVESNEELEFASKIKEKGKKHDVPKSGNYFAQDDINQLFELIDIKSSAKHLGALRKSALKRPIRVSSSQALGIGISEPVNLKQALRGLCISQAAEMAAMKRLSKPEGSSRPSEAGNIKRLYRAVVIEANASELLINEGKGNLFQFSLVPEKNTPNYSEQVNESSQMLRAEPSGHTAHLSTSLDIVSKPKAILNKLPSLDQVVPLATEFMKEKPKPKLQNLNSSVSITCEIVNEVEMIAPSSVESPVNSSLEDQGKKGKLSTGYFSSSSNCSRLSKCGNSSPHLIKPVSQRKGFVKSKAKQDCTSASSSSTPYVSATSDREDVETSTASRYTSMITEVNSSVGDTSLKKQGLRLNFSRTKVVAMKGDERSQSREKGEFSQSSKSSIGEYSSTTSISEDSVLSGSSRGDSRPHMSNDLRWEAIRCAQKQHGCLGMRHFKLQKKLGFGDIGTIYLAELSGTGCLFALKVMDIEFLMGKKKMPRAQTEREIMQMLDHPFLPTLFTSFTTDKFSCLVMEHCPGGDLHVLRQKQPGRFFSEQAARFYVSEVLLALEYVHMLGVVYRDLKPENILIREDGHIMLSDFDLSLRCAVNSRVVKSSSPVQEPPPKKASGPCSEASCIDPFCLHPSWQVSCFTPRLLSVAAKSRKIKSDLAARVSPALQLIVEPISARSNSFVGTHEYLAPEIIKGEGHGSPVDWWTFGIFIFELLYGRTPFKGSVKEETLSNVVSQSLRFPAYPVVSFHARDLIRGLLVKEPDIRLGAVKGAAEIKQHPFFQGLNWALIRCAVPPELPKPLDAITGSQPVFSKRKGSTEFEESNGAEDHVEFEMF